MILSTGFDLTIDIDKLSEIAKKQEDPLLKARQLRPIILARALQGKPEFFYKDLTQLDQTILKLKLPENNSLIAWILGTKLLAAIHMGDTTLIKNTKVNLQTVLTEIKPDDACSAWALGYLYLGSFAEDTAKNERKEIRDRLFIAIKMLIADYKVANSKSVASDESKGTNQTNLAVSLSNILWACINGILAIAYVNDALLDKDEINTNEILVHELREFMFTLTGKKTAPEVSIMAMMPGWFLGYVQYAAVRRGEHTLYQEAARETDNVINPYSGKTDFLSLLDATLCRLYTYESLKYMCPGKTI